MNRRKLTKLSRILSPVIMLVMVMSFSMPMSVFAGSAAATPAAKVKVKKVTLNMWGKTLAAKKTVTLKATIEPKNASNKKLTWKSSKPKIAKVSSSGKVTALKKGTATITATAKDGSKKKATCKINVGGTAVTSVVLDQTSKLVEPGGDFTLVATTTPEKPSIPGVLWQSSNTKVATVSSTGLVKGITEGSATITATTKDGAKKASCAVTVAPIVNALAPTITTQPTSPAPVDKGGPTPSISVAASSPDGGTLSYQWWSNTSASNSGGTEVTSGGKSATYSAPTANDGTFYYYCVVTNTNDTVNGTKTATTKSNVATVKVNPLVNAQTPNITTQPAPTTTVVKNTGVNLSVVASSPDGGGLSYQWHSSTTNSNAGNAPILGETGMTYSPPTDTAGTFYYFCVVTNTNNSVNGNKTADTRSNVATVNVTLTDAESILAAKGDLEGATYNTSCVNAETQNAAITAVESLINKMSLYGVNTSVNVVSFSAATDGNETTPEGIPGQLQFTVTITKGAATPATTTTLTMTITPKRYGSIDPILTQALYDELLLKGAPVIIEHYKDEYYPEDNYPYGEWDYVQLDGDWTIPSGYRLIIPEGVVLAVGNSYCLTVSPGTLENNGALWLQTDSHSFPIVNIVGTLGTNYFEGSTGTVIPENKKGFDWALVNSNNLHIWADREGDGGVTAGISFTIRNGLTLSNYGTVDLVEENMTIENGGAFYNYEELGMWARGGEAPPSTPSVDLKPGSTFIALAGPNAKLWAGDYANIEWGWDVGFVDVEVDDDDFFVVNPFEIPNGKSLTLVDSILPPEGTAEDVGWMMVRAPLTINGTLYVNGGLQIDTANGIPDATSTANIVLGDNAQFGAGCSEGLEWIMNELEQDVEVDSNLTFSSNVTIPDDCTLTVQYVDGSTTSASVTMTMTGYKLDVDGTLIVSGDAGNPIRVGTVLNGTINVGADGKIECYAPGNVLGKIDGSTVNGVPGATFYTELAGCCTMNIFRASVGGATAGAVAGKTYDWNVNAGGSGVGGWVARP